MSAPQVGRRTFWATILSCRILTSLPFWHSSRNCQNIGAYMMGLSGKLLIDCPKPAKSTSINFCITETKRICFWKKKYEKIQKKCKMPEKKKKRKTTWKTNETNQRSKLKVLKR
jgi:hypothetical protein